MKHSEFDAPIWGEAIIEGFNQQEAEIEIFARPQKPINIISIMEEVESLIRYKEYKQALLLLDTMDFTLPLVRKFMFECYIHLEMVDKILELFYPPQSNSEICLFLEFLWEKRDIHRLRQLLQMDGVKDSDDPSVKHLSKKYTSLVED